MRSASMRLAQARGAHHQSRLDQDLMWRFQAPTPWNQDGENGSPWPAFSAWSAGIEAGGGRISLRSVKLIYCQYQEHVICFAAAENIFGLLPEIRPDFEFGEVGPDQRSA